MYIDRSPVSPSPFLFTPTDHRGQSLAVASLLAFLGVLPSGSLSYSLVFRWSPLFFYPRPGAENGAYRIKLPNAEHSRNERDEVNQQHPPEAEYPVQLGAARRHPQLEPTHPAQVQLTIMERTRIVMEKPEPTKLIRRSILKKLPTRKISSSP